MEGPHAWNSELNRAAYRSLLRESQFTEIAARAIRIESRTNLLFSFEKTALRDAVKSAAGARSFFDGPVCFSVWRWKRGAQI